jgi:drug/metabolite transporter (DMT)-like permease
LGDDDDYHCKFAKPWFSVLEMKAAMAVCLLLYYGLGVGKEAGTPDPDWRTIKKVWLPALLDLLNTVFCNIGLVWVSSSIYQMTRGSVVVFSAILSVKWLGRTLRSFHYYSIALVLVAVVLVGLAGTEEKPATDDDCVGDDG